jgi:hypothetical protein
MILAMSLKLELGSDSTLRALSSTLGMGGRSLTRLMMRFLISSLVNSDLDASDKGLKTRRSPLSPSSAFGLRSMTILAVQAGQGKLTTLP